MRRGGDEEDEEVREDKGDGCLLHSPSTPPFPPLSLSLPPQNSAFKTTVPPEKDRANAYISSCFRNRRR
jgi:hypothetical protein